MADTDFFGQLLENKSIGRFLLTLRQYERDLHIPTHQHLEPYLTVVVGGGYDELCGGSSRACASGDVILHAAGERHADRFSARTRCLDLHGGTVDRGAHLPADTAGALSKRLVREFTQTDHLSAQVIDALLLELSIEAERARPGDLKPAWLRHVRSAIETGFRGDVGLRALAAEVNVHPAHLARSFRRHYGRTIGELVRELRVEYARRALGAGVPPKRVAADTGFADQSHLTRSFRRLTGMTPAAYQRLHAISVQRRN